MLVYIKSIFRFDAVQCTGLISACVCAHVCKLASVFLNIYVTIKAQD